MVSQVLKAFEHISSTEEEGTITFVCQQKANVKETLFFFFSFQWRWANDFKECLNACFNFQKDGYLYLPMICIYIYIYIYKSLNEFLLICELTAKSQWIAEWINDNFFTSKRIFIDHCHWCRNYSTMFISTKFWFELQNII